MFRIKICVILIVFIGSCHLSYSTDCIATTYSQDLDASQLATSRMTMDGFATATRGQMAKRLKEIFNETAVRMNCSITKTDQLIRFAYNIIYACNETITTTDGMIETIRVNPKINQAKVDNMISCGLIDRANHVALRAEQVSLGIRDISCEFHFGTENFLEWGIEGSSSTIERAISKSSAENYHAFQKALLAHFSTKLTKLYARRIANVSLLARNTLANGRIRFTFRIFFLKVILDKNLRTKIVSNIQSAYYDIIKNYFADISRSAKLPRSVQINAPTNVNIGSRIITFVNQKAVFQSMVSSSAAKTESENDLDDKANEQGSTKTGARNIDGSVTNDLTTLSGTDTVADSMSFDLADAPILTLMVTEPFVTPTPVTRPRTTQSTTTTLAATTTATTTPSPTTIATTTLPPTTLAATTTATTTPSPTTTMSSAAPTDTIVTTFTTNTIPMTTTSTLDTTETIMSTSSRLPSTTATTTTTIEPTTTTRRSQSTRSTTVITRVTHKRRTYAPKPTHAPCFRVRKIRVHRRPYRLKHFGHPNNYGAFLISLLRRRWIESLFSSETQSRICKASDIYVNYIYAYDIHDQALNSSFQDLNSDVVHRLQSRIADWTSAELSKRNLLSYIPDRVRILKIVDVTDRNDNHPTIRLYISINLPKNLIPTICHIFENLHVENVFISRENIF